MATSGTFGTAFEVILLMTGTLSMTAAQAVTNLVLCTSGLPATLTLPTVQQMVAAQNLTLWISNKSSSGGTLTVAAASGDSIGGGATTAAVSTGLICKHDGLKTWYIF